MSAEEERKLLAWVSWQRKRHNCVLGTTQALTRVATHFRQMVDTVWVMEKIRPGRLHVATAFDPPQDGGMEIWTPEWFDPRDSRIPTSAVAWNPYMDGAHAAPAAAPVVEFSAPVVKW
jgi:hypothetical protein